MLYDLLSDLALTDRDRLPDVEITGVEIDSRLVKPGCLFIARPGQKGNGADFALDAIRQGAVLVIAETGCPDPELQSKWITVPDAAVTFADCSRWFHGYADRELQLIGITGTNGKTTTSFLVRHLIEESGMFCAVLGTTGAYWLEKFENLSHTTPEAPVLQQFFRKFSDDGCSMVSMEVSSHSLSLERVQGLQFKVAAFTNLTHDHLDFHGNMNAYAQAKAKLFRQVAPDGLAVLNADDPHSEKMIHQLKIPVLTYGLTAGADLKGKIKSSGINGQVLSLTYRGVPYQVTVPLPGRFNAYNALAAVGCAIGAGIPAEDAIGYLSTAKPVPGRFELVTVPDKQITGVVDYSHTPDSLEKILLAIREIRTADQAIITVVGCGGDRDKTKRPIMAEVACRLSDHVLITSDNPRTEDPEAIIQDMVTGLTASNFITLTDRREAIRKAIAQAKPGSIILVAGKGHETYQEIKGVRYPFDDRLVFREELIHA